jgi:hypothetical protein
MKVDHIVFHFVANWTYSVRELLQIKLNWIELNRCERMETITFLGKTESVFQWNGNYRCISVSPQNFPETNNIDSNNWLTIPLQNSFRSVSPESFSQPIYPLQTHFVASGPFLYCFIANGPFCSVSKAFQKRNTVAKSLLHKRRVETFLSVSARFSLQIRFKQKVATDISE